MNSNSGRSGLFPIIGCLIVQLCVGIIYLWSIFKSPIVSAYHWTAQAAGMVSSYMLVGFVTGSLLGGFLNDRKGPRFTCILGVALFSLGIGLTALLTPATIGLIYLTYSCIAGIGSGLAYSACISCVQKWLPHRKGLASGLAVSAFGLSTVAFAPVAQRLMSLFTDAATGLVDFKLVFLTLAGIFFALGFLGCCLIRLPAAAPSAAPGSAAASEGRDLTLGQAVRTLPFWCIFFTIFFINGTWNLAVPLIYDLGIAKGLSATAATFAVSFTGIPNAAGRLIMAALSDKLGRMRTICSLALLTLLGALLMVHVQGIAYIAVVAVIAFAYGGPSSVNAAFCTDYFGAKNSGANYGAAMLALGLSSLFFNTVSNQLLGGDITATFTMAAVTAVIPMLLMALLHKYDSARVPHSVRLPSLSLPTEIFTVHSPSRAQ